MAKLFVTGEVSAESAGARVGGKPIALAATAWPLCKRCGGPLRFIAQHPLEGGAHVLAFQCENAPGMCDEWAPASGANLVMVVSGGVPLNAPTATKNPGAQPTFGPPVGLGASGDREVGILGGEPQWIQADETPECCGSAMRFVMQLEESAHRQLNFCGGGAAYVFVCTACNKGAYIMQQ
jgi:hypothetical protein